MYVVNFITLNRTIMLRLAILFFCAINISATFFSKFSGDKDFSIDTKPLWVLTLNDDTWNSLQLKAATPEDKKQFERYAAPMINKYLQSRRTVVKKYKAKLENTEKPVTPRESTQEIKTRLFKYINEFLLFKANQADSHLVESFGEPPLTIYFKGPFTAILLEYEVRHWLFFIPPPSPLPSWFYQDHANTVTGVMPNVVVIPDDVKDELYPPFLNMMMTLLGDALF